MMDKLSPVDVSTLQERVYLTLRHAISQGDFAPGELLTIRTLAASLGTSAMPVREALQRLVAEKALVQQSNRSVGVAPFTLDGHRELIRIRTTIESMATRSAVLRGDAGLVAQLQELNARMREAVEARDPTATLDANRNFHFALYAGARMPQLFDIIQGMWLRTGPYLGAALRLVPGAEAHFLTGTRIHDRVIDAMRRGDANAAGRALSADLWFSARHFRPVMAKLDPTLPGNQPAAEAAPAPRRRGRPKQS